MKLLLVLRIKISMDFIHISSNVNIVVNLIDLALTEKLIINTIRY